VLFESWAPLTLPSRDVSRSLHGSVGREEIGGANASGAQPSDRRKAGAARIVLELLELLARFLSIIPAQCLREATDECTPARGSADADLAGL
jgi:hypothetical protein